MAAFSGLCVLLLGSAAGLLREAGWWGISQQLGALSQRIAQSSRDRTSHLATYEGVEMGYVTGESGAGAFDIFKRP